MRQDVVEFQKAIDRAVCILIEMKRRRGLTRTDRDEVDDCVRSLQDVSRSIGIVIRDADKRLIVGVIQKIIRLWERVRGAGG